MRSTRMYKLTNNLIDKLIISLLVYLNIYYSRAVREVGRRAFQLRRRSSVSKAGAIGSENADMSSVNPSEIDGHRKSQGSLAR